MLLDSFSSGSDFFDDANFPYGFARSGDFTISEANDLTTYGQIMHKLATGKMPAENEDHEHFVQVIEGNAEASNKLENLYLKYKYLTEKQSVFLNPFDQSIKHSDDEEDEEDADIDDMSYNDV